MSAPEAASGVAPRPWSERRVKVLPLMLVALLIGLGFILIPDQSVWRSTTLSGLAMGMVYFIMTSGLTLVSGLMPSRVLGHGAIALFGAALGCLVFWSFPRVASSPAMTQSIVAIVGIVAAAMIAAGLAGMLTDRARRRPGNGAHVMLSLVILAALVIAARLLESGELLARSPDLISGLYTWQGVEFSPHQLAAIAIGLGVLLMMRFVLRYTKFGLIVRAGIEDGELVGAMGYRLKLVFLTVFVVGIVLAGLGAVAWGLSQEVITIDMSFQIAIAVFVIMIIGGRGSVEGCFVAAILVGLTQSYMTHFDPNFVDVSLVGLMILILIWRPQGLLPLVPSR